MRRRLFIQSTLAASLIKLVVPSEGLAGEVDSTVPWNKAVPYRKLAMSHKLMRDKYDFVVIGSGYGGSVLSSKLAGKASVCLLERGKEWAPGTFGETALKVAQQIRNERNSHGLFDMKRFRDIDVLSGSGLGGTSLINANVVIEPESDIFESSVWPEEVKKDSQNGVLSKYFDRVRYMLQVQSYKDSDTELKKAEMHKESTEALGEDFVFADLAVNLHKYDSEPNHVGVMQPKCHNCGNCVIGCNTGAKSTLNFNYLPVAQANGAEIFTKIEVSHLEKLENGEGYKVVFKKHLTPTSYENGFVIAKNVIVSAGTVGSNQILLRSQKLANVSLSEKIGHRFSGNGDMLGFSYNTNSRLNSIGYDKYKTDRPASPSGPTILGIASYQKNRNNEDRFLIQEGGIPFAFAEVTDRLVPTMVGPSKNDTNETHLRVTRDILGYNRGNGAMNHTMVYLGMGVDQGTGRIELNGSDEANVHWRNVDRDPIFKKIETQFKRFSDYLGGKYVKNPRARTLMGKNMMTVHPLGGCSMGRSHETGVVNHKGQVFDGSGSVHEGLYVADGSIIPGALGVNPLLTISALSERIADYIIREKLS